MIKNENFKLISEIIFVLLFLCLFTYIISNNRSLHGNMSRVFNMNSIEIEEISGGILNENTFPVSDEVGIKQKGYTFKINNKNNDSVKYKLKLISSEDNTLDTKYIKISYNINDGEYSEPVTLDKFLYIIDNIDGNDSNIYNIKMWIDINADNSVMNKTFSTRLGLETI